MRPSLRFLPGHTHPHREGVVHRAPASVKLAVAALLLLGTALQTGLHPVWFLPAWLLLAWAWWNSRLTVGFVLARVLWLSPFVAGVALAGAWRPADGPGWQILAVKSVTSLCTVILLANTTPFPEVLRVLRHIRVPSLLVTTLALMHRYIFVLVEEAERMRRARLARLFTPGRNRLWMLQASVAGRLFLRASERGGRIYQAILARGGS